MGSKIFLNIFWLLVGSIIELLAEVLIVLIRGFYFLYCRIAGPRTGLIAPKNPNGRSPILLVHGLNMDEVCMWVLRWRMKKDGWGPIYILNLGPHHWMIEENAQLLKEAIDHIKERHGPVHLVAHSMGGLIARYYLQEMQGAPNIRSLITLATPHQGTPVAHLAITLAGRQMIPEKPIFARLNKSGNPLPQGVYYLFLWSNLDVIVPFPWGRPGKKIGFGDLFVFVPYLGHMTILLSRGVYRLIDQALERITLPV